MIQSLNLLSKWPDDNNLYLSEQKKGDKTNDDWIIKDKRQYKFWKIAGISCNQITNL